MDLVLIDVQGSSTNVLNCLADHKAVLTKLPIAPILESTIDREIWHFKSVPWSQLQNELASLNWQIDTDTAEEALTFFLENFWYHLVKHIPR